MNEINKDRTTFIGGSDAARIIKGDWLSLWNEKTGKVQPEDLSNQFNVQLGKWTEPFHRNWVAEKILETDIDVCVGQNPHQEHDFIRAQLDGWLPAVDTFIEFKHSNSNTTLDSGLEWWLPQLAHYCAVMGRNECYISYIAGNTGPNVHKITVPDDYIDNLILKELEFWWHVTEDQPPADRPAPSEGGSSVAGLLIDDMRTVDMDGNNMWADMARTLVDTKPIVDAHEAAKKGIKSLIDDDVREAFGHGVVIRRDKRGSLRLNIKEKGA